MISRADAYALATKVAALGEYADRKKFVKGKMAGQDLMADFIEGARRNPRLGYVQIGSDGGHTKVAALGAMDAARTYLGPAINSVKKFTADPHRVELAGLAALGVPAAYHAATDDKPANRAMSALELGGLGALAIPTIQQLRR